MELHDCKGTKGEVSRGRRRHRQGAQRKRPFPLPVFFVWRLKNGEWQKQRM
jgi:hypothetical protein